MSAVQKVRGTDTFDVLVQKLNGAIDGVNAARAGMSNAWSQINVNTNNLSTAQRNIRDIQDDIVDVTEAEMTAYVTSLYS